MSKNEPSSPQVVIVIEARLVSIVFIFQIYRRKDHPTNNLPKSEARTIQTISYYLANSSFPLQAIIYCLIKHESCIETKYDDFLKTSLNLVLRHRMPIT